MGSNVNSGTLSLKTALQLRANSWNLRMDRFGDVFNAGEIGSTVGPLHVSILGAQVAHDSLIDRFVIQYQPGGKPLDIRPVEGRGQGDGAQDRILVSRERPLMQPLAGPLFIFCRSGDYYDSDPALGGYEDESGVLVPFSPFTFQGQSLSANLILKRPINALYGTRSSFEVGANRRPTLLTGPGTEDTLAIAPVAGRKHIRVALFAAPGGPAVTSWRLTGLVGSYVTDGGPIIIPRNRLHEVPLVSGAAIPAGNTATLTLEDPNVRFLCVKATGAAPGQVFHWLKATDE
jgi:hypothetical protein